MEVYVPVDDDVRLRVRVDGGRGVRPLLLAMGAASSGLVWPDELVARLGEQHRVVRYDHRDTGRSSWSFATRPYALTDLADDAVAVLDALGLDRAHVVGMSMGGTLVQLLLLDHPDRLLSATLFSTGVLTDPAAPLPPVDVDPRLLAFWQTMPEPRDRAAELDWRVEHWRLLNGDRVPFDEAGFRRLEERVVEDAGRHDTPTAHALAGTDGLARGGELGGVRTPVLVLDAPADPVYPPPSAARIAAAIPTARLGVLPGMGHALAAPVLGPLADAVLEHTAAVEAVLPGT